MLARSFGAGFITGTVSKGGVFCTLDCRGNLLKEKQRLQIQQKKPPSVWGLFLFVICAGVLLKIATKSGI